MGLNAFVIASTIVSRLDSFPAIMGLARGSSKFIENKKATVNISVGSFSRVAIFRRDLRVFSDRRFADLPDSTEIGAGPLGTSESDVFGGRPGGRGRF